MDDQLPTLEELLAEPPMDPTHGLGNLSDAAIDAAYTAIARPKRSTTIAGVTLATRLEPRSVRRYRTAVFLERQLLENEEPAQELGAVALAMCQILELELTQKLVEPCRAIVASLLEAFEPGERFSEVLVAWRDSRLPTSLGVVHVMMTALRRSIPRQSGCIAVLTQHFTEDYVTLLASKGLERAIGEMRNRYRNPLAHGTLDLDTSAYAAFSRALVGADRVLTWDQRGPSTTSSDVALLHHHLSCWRAAAES